MIGVGNCLESCSRSSVPHPVIRVVIIHCYAALGILHRERTFSTGIHVCEIVIRRDGIVCPSTGVQRLCQGPGDGAIAVWRGWQIQICRVSIIAAADVGASWGNDAVSTLTDRTCCDPGREGTALETTVLDDGTTAIACGCCRGCWWRC